MFGGRHRTSAVIAGLVVIGALGPLLVTVSGCRDENDPNYWLGKMDDVVWRDQALTNLERLFSEKMREVNNNRDDPAMQEFVKTVSGGLIQNYQSMSQAATQDVTSMNKIVSLLSQMETTDALPVYTAALSDVSGTKIGRAMRAVVDMPALGERTFYVDCDVIQADGGTRTAAINGAFVAMVDALRKMQESKRVKKMPVEDYLAAVSIGIVDGKVLLDLCYQEDSQADVDLTLVMTGSGRLVEVQAGGEGTTFTRDDLDSLIGEGAKGIKKVIKWQKEILGNLR